MLLYKALVRYYLKHSVNSSYPCSRRMHANCSRGCKEGYYTDQRTRDIFKRKLREFACSVYVNNGLKGQDTIQEQGVSIPAI